MGTVGRTQPHREEVVNFFNFDSITTIMTSTTVTRLLSKAVKPGARSLSNAPQAATATQSMGLNFNVTEEQQEFLDLAEQFTKNEIIPVAPHYDRTEPGAGSDVSGVKTKADTSSPHTARRSGARHASVSCTRSCPALNPRGRCASR